MSQLTVQELVQQNIGLISLPDVALKLNTLIDDPHSTAQDIADVIAMDAALTARLLQIVNSPFYNFPQQIDTITMAITVVGTAQLCDLAMATLVIHKFNYIPQNLLSLETFWCHNIACATAARTIVTELGIQQAERVFVAGLLHDIGKLMMYLTEPDLSYEVLKRLKSNIDLDVSEVEKATFGYDHAELGAALLKEWGLPDALVEPVRYHHIPEQANKFATESNVLHLANAVANQIAPLFPNNANLALDDRVWTIFNSTSAHLKDIVGISKTVYHDTVGIFYSNQDVVKRIYSSPMEASISA